MAKILVAEDDAEAAEIIQQLLEVEKHSVELAYDGEAALFRLTNYFYELAIIDWEMPKLSGPSLIERFRRAGGKIPILMLTGKQQVDELESGLDSGADDYLTKPYRGRELLARVRALLRRAPEVTSNVLSCRHVSLDLVANQCFSGGEEVKLLPTEFALLEFFLRHREGVFSVEALLERVWNAESDATDMAVRTAVSRLRKKLEKPDEKPLIETVHGFGYRLGLIP